MCTLFYEKNRDHYGIAFERYSRTNVITCVERWQKSNKLTRRSWCGMTRTTERKLFSNLQTRDISHVTLKPSSPVRLYDSWLICHQYSTDTGPIFCWQLHDTPLIRVSTDTLTMYRPTYYFIYTSHRHISVRLGRLAVEYRPKCQQICRPIHRLCFSVLQQAFCALCAVKLEQSGTTSTVA